MGSDKVRVGDTVRIHDNANVRPEAQGKLAEVTKVESRNIQAGVYVDVGVAFVRVAHGEYDKGSGW